MKTLLGSIRKTARRDALAFVQEFGEALDTAATDWGFEAFTPWEHRLLPVPTHAEECPEEGRYHVARVNALAVRYEALVARETRRLLA